MKRPSPLVALLLLCAFAFSLAAREAWLPKSAGPPACFSGEPPRHSTCHTSGCHADFPVNSGGATLLLDLGGAEGGYTPGQLYTIRVALTHAGLARGGFQAIALQDNKDTLSPGTITLTEPLRTQRIDRNFPHADTGCTIYSKVWVEHTDFGIDDPIQDTIRWRFHWQAPSTDVGTITFYAAAVEANSDLDPTGDHVYSLSRTISSPSTSISPTHPPVLLLSPSIVGDQLHFHLDGRTPSPTDRVALHDATGRKVMESPLVAQLPVAGLAPGMYWVRITLEGETWVQRMWKD